MHFFGTVERLVAIPDDVLDRALARVQGLRAEDFKYRDTNTRTQASSWWRTDGWLKADRGPVLNSLMPMVEEVGGLIMDHWPRAEKVLLSYFNVSVITPREYIDEHVDPKLCNKLSYRVLVPLNRDIPFRYHWLVRDRKVFGEIRRGHAWHFNNNTVHAAYNASDEMRYALMFDFSEERLFRKFSGRADWTRSLVTDTANKDFIRRHEGHVY